MEGKLFSTGKTIRKRYVRGWFSSTFLFLFKTVKIILQVKREEGASGFHMYKWQYLQHQSKHLRCLLLLQGCWQRICRWAFHYLIVMWSTFLNCYFPKEHHFQKTDKTRLVDYHQLSRSGTQNRSGRLHPQCWSLPNVHSQAWLKKELIQFQV